MTFKKITRALGITALLLTTAACGGGGGGGGGSSSHTGQPIRTLTDADLAKAGVTKNTPKKFASYATVNQYGERTDGTLMPDYNSRRAVAEMVVGPNVVEVLADGDMNGRLGDPSDDTPILRLNADRHQGVTNQEVTIGGEKALMARSGSGSDQTVYYVPRANSDMWAGGYGESYVTAGRHGVFGRETTAAEMDARIKLGGSASYTGYAAATVTRHPANTGTSSHHGHYVDQNAKGNVDFRAGTVSTSATLRPAQGSSGPNVSMTSTGRMNANGRITGTASFTGLDRTPVTGSIDGRFFGPNAQTMGGTFMGSTANAGVAGHMVLNKD